MEEMLTILLHEILEPLLKLLKLESIIDVFCSLFNFFKEIWGKGKFSSTLSFLHSCWFSLSSYGIPSSEFIEFIELQEIY